MGDRMRSGEIVGDRRRCPPGGTWRRREGGTGALEQRSRGRQSNGRRSLSVAKADASRALPSVAIAVGGKRPHLRCLVVPDAIRSNQTQSDAIRRNRTQSDATRAHGLVPTHCPTPRQPQTTARRARGRSEPHRACHDCVAATPTTTGAHAPHRMCGHLHTVCGDGGGGGGGGMVGNVEEEGPPPPGLIPDPTFVERCDA